VAVQVNGLRMRFGGTEVLHGVDFDVRYGEVFCLLGPNGAGKTTTLEILEGFRPPTGGKVQVLGLDPAAQSARLRERAGMVLEECGFPRQARVAELIDLWQTYYPNPRTLADLLGVVELTEVRNTQVRKLSGGQRRRLDFALALAGDPDLVFLDEPTTGFDPEAHHPLPGRGGTVGRPDRQLASGPHRADRDDARGRGPGRTRHPDLLHHTLRAAPRSGPASARDRPVGPRAGVGLPYRQRGHDPAAAARLGAADQPTGH
jgi:ABC-type branched-subunit amino acid transport system ATPase component